MAEETEENVPVQAQEEEKAPEEPEVDLQALAREVIALLKRELRLEQERSGRG